MRHLFTSDRLRRGLHYLAMAIVAVLSAGMGMPLIMGATLATESPVTMWDKVDQRLANATPCAQMVFRELKSWAMQHLKGLNLQLVDMADVTTFTSRVTGPMRVYAIYLKKQGTATAAFFDVVDDATNDATAGDRKLSVGLLEASKEAFVVYPDGLSLADGLVSVSYTALAGSNGTTASTSGDGPNGFVLVG